MLVASLPTLAQMLRNRCPGVRSGCPDTPEYAIVGAYRADPNGVDAAGRVYVVFGKEDTDRVQLADVAQGIGGFALDGEGENHHAGTSLRGAGDINGDGIPDLIIGAPEADPTGFYATGRTYVVFGGDFSCEER